MKIFIYIITPIITWVLELIFRGIYAILTGPIVYIQQKIDHNIGMFKFRADMIVSGFCAGYSTVYVLNYLNLHYALEIAKWWVICSTCLIIILHLSSWDRNKPFWYEISLNASVSIGYILGLITILY